MVNERNEDLSPEDETTLIYRFIRVHKQYAEKLNETTQQLFELFSREKMNETPTLHPYHHEGKSKVGSEDNEWLNRAMKSLPDRDAMTSPYFAPPPKLPLSPQFSLYRSEVKRYQHELDEIAAQRLTPWKSQIVIEGKLNNVRTASDQLYQYKKRRIDLYSKANGGKGGKVTEGAEFALLSKRIAELVETINQYQKDIQTKTKGLMTNCESTPLENKLTL